MNVRNRDACMYGSVKRNIKEEPRFSPFMSHGLMVTRSRLFMLEGKCVCFYWSTQQENVLFYWLCCFQIEGRNCSWMFDSILLFTAFILGRIGRKVPPWEENQTRTWIYAKDVLLSALTAVSSSPTLSILPLPGFVPRSFVATCCQYKLCTGGIVTLQHPPPQQETGAFLTLLGILTILHCSWTSYIEVFCVGDYLPAAGTDTHTSPLNTRERGSALGISLSGRQRAQQDSLVVKLVNIDANLTKNGGDTSVNLPFSNRLPLDIFFWINSKASTWLICKLSVKYSLTYVFMFCFSIIKNV